MKLFIMTRFMLMSLVVFFIGGGCQLHRNPKEPEDVEIIWNGSKAEKIAISKKLTGELDKGYIEEELMVYLDTNSTTNILGHYEWGEDKVIFTPLIPFTHGKT